MDHQLDSRFATLLVSKFASFQLFFHTVHLPKQSPREMYTANLRHTEVSPDFCYRRNIYTCTTVWCPPHHSRSSSVQSSSVQSSTFQRESNSQPRIRPVAVDNGEREATKGELQSNPAAILRPRIAMLLIDIIIQLLLLVDFSLALAKFI